MLSEFDQLMGKLRPELTRAFSCIPDYGSLGIVIHFHEKEPIKVEYNGSISRRLAKVNER
ncbi:MAG: hypothetical protein WC182_02150 [Bacilli bacterium]|jgi:hypothetical protein